MTLISNMQTLQYKPYDKVPERCMQFSVVKNLIFAIITWPACEHYTSFL